MMTQGGGSNSLRGGMKMFGPKTKNGNWMELEKEPGKALPAGFPHTMYLSDAHNQMLSSSLSQKNKRYGAGLPPPEESFVDYGRIMNYDKRQGESRWASITSTEFVTPSEANEKDKEFASIFKLTGGLADPVKLKEYRNKWTSEESNLVRAMRFKTEAIIGANTAVPPNFRLGQTRKIPGTPKAVDRLRAKVLGHGPRGIIKLRQALLGSRPRCSIHLHASDLANALKAMGAQPLAQTDNEKVLDFFAGEKGTAAEASDLVHAITGTMNERRRRAANYVLGALYNTNTGVIKKGEVKRLFDTALSGGPTDKKNSEALKAAELLPDHWHLYQDKEEEYVTIEGFDAFLSDLSGGIESDEDFEAMVKSLLVK